MVTQESTTKSCRKCQKPFPRTSAFFPAKGRSRDGLESLCWECARDVWRGYKPSRVSLPGTVPSLHPQFDLFQRLCQCGCGQPTQGRFVHGHNSRVQNLMRTMEGVRQFRLSRTVYSREQVLAQRKQERDMTKQEVLTHYGHGNCACIRCGFDDIRALSIDHIDGSGHVQRKKDKITGGYFYRWLQLQGYPEGFQTLCMNCQWIKRSENGEHTQKKTLRTSNDDIIMAKTA